MIIVFILGVGARVPERAEVHVGVGVNNAAWQALGAGPPVNGVGGGGGEGAVPGETVLLEVVELDLEGGEDDESDDHRE